MDNGLSPAVIVNLILHLKVLILIVMDNGLSLFVKKDGNRYAGLNPYCNG